MRSSSCIIHRKHTAHDIAMRRLEIAVEGYVLFPYKSTVMSDHSCCPIPSYSALLVDFSIQTQMRYSEVSPISPLPRRALSTRASYWQTLADIWNKTF
jgi:hypothetical protein